MARSGANGKKVVLVVEDDVDMNELLCSILSENGYSPVSAFNGEEAFSLARKARPGLILLDIMLPDQDGVDICRNLVRSEDTRGIPIIMVTVRHELTAKLSSFIAGARRFITKPFQVEDLLHEVELTLKQAERPGAPDSIIDPRD
ncbi:MAG: response regulator [bacterium]